MVHTKQSLALAHRPGVCIGEEAGSADELPSPSSGAPQLSVARGAARISISTERWLHPIRRQYVRDYPVRRAETVGTR